MHSTNTNEPAAAAEVAARILREGYGPGAWHGADFKAALAELPADIAFWRPRPGRHSIAEIALHHAYTTRGVRAKLTGQAAEPFVLEGDDWFGVDEGAGLGWTDIRAVVDKEQHRIESAVAQIESGRATSPLSASERFDLVLGITCHAVYHAGQVQLIRALHG
jgi:hypothetical protein